jgi:hypothetical protein
LWVFRDLQKPFDFTNPRAIDNRRRKARVYISFLCGKWGLGDNQAVSVSVDDKIAELEARLSQSEKKIKGYAGQISQLRAKTGMGRPGETVDKPETSPIQAQTGESKPQEALQKHVAYSFMRDCPECGGANPSYQTPNVFCNSPECKGIIPLGHIDPEKDIEKKDGKELIPKIKDCWNCGRTGDELGVIVREAKK